MEEGYRIAFVSGKLGDVDGVSLEVDKWIEILSKQGHEIFTIAGKYTNPVENVLPERQLLLEKIGFDSSDQKKFEKLVFPHLSKFPPHLTEDKKQQVMEELVTQGHEVGESLYDYIQEFDIDVIVSQNLNAMPMSLLGGVAVYYVATKKRVATIFHHHDFWWERSRFSNNCIENLLNKIMPPADLGLEHVVISSYAAHILSSIKRVHPHVVPNCEDFDEVTTLDDYNSDFRKELGFEEDDILIVQPTRIVPRKKIEDSVELIGKFITKYPDLDGKTKLIISLYQGDEPDNDYINQIKKLTEERNVPLYMISERVSSVRQTDGSGKKMYTNRDVLANADLVTYLPIWEGFGNALLEAIAARVPVVTTTYLVYKTDIKVTGLNNIEIRDRYDENGRLIIPDSTVEEMHRLINDKVARKALVEENFRIASEEFGYQTLENKLNQVFYEYGDEIRASRKRLRKSKRNYSV